jgi:hypothetical protein
VTVGYCSGEHGGVVENVLGNMDGTLHTVADLRSDVTLMRFLYGVPLWAIQGAKRWEASAVSVQTSERATHNFLDPRWAEEILTLVPQSREHEEDLWLFTMFCRSGKIKKEGFTYHLYGTRLDGIRDRSAMFMEFRRLLSDGKISRTRAHREVEQFLITGRDDLAIVELLTDYLARMQRKLSKDAQGGVDRQEIKLLRDEIPVVKKFLGRKKSDLDLDGDVEEEEKDEVRESTPQDQLAWILTVFCCDGRIREEDGKYFLGDRLLEGVEGRKSLLDAFGRAFEEGALSRDEATRYVQDFLISGENLLSAVHRLSAHMGALETAVTSAAPEDAAVLNEELELLRAYIAKREASAGDGASGGKAGADFQDESF